MLSHSCRSVVSSAAVGLEMPLPGGRFFVAAVRLDARCAMRYLLSSGRSPAGRESRSEHGRRRSVRGATPRTRCLILLDFLLPLHAWPCRQLPTFVELAEASLPEFAGNGSPDGEQLARGHTGNGRNHLGGENRDRLPAPHRRKHAGRFHVGPAPLAAARFPGLLVSDSWAGFLCSSLCPGIDP